MVTWGTIDCIERNGVITGYTVVFQEQGGANVTSSTSTELQDRMFSATELTPFTNYIFRVAGVNDDGTGVFAVLTITTDEEGLLNCMCLVMINLIDLSPHSSWSCVRPHC